MNSSNFRCGVFVFAVCILRDSSGFNPAWLSWVIGGCAGALAWGMIVWEARQ